MDIHVIRIQFMNTSEFVFIVILYLISHFYSTISGNICICEQ
jgi:hypothetical protein